MAIILYSNGLTEEFAPKQHTFSDQEIVTLFSEFDNIKTQRLDEVPNTWCVWGEYKAPQADDYNKLGSDVLQAHCYSHIVFLHDTEVDPSWNLSESIIHFGYPEFKNMLLKFLDDIAKQTLEEIEQMRAEQGQPNLMVLEQMAVSEDKRIIFNFDPNRQPKEFYNVSSFPEFAQKCYNFLIQNYKDGKVFAVFADKRMILVLTDDNVKIFIDHLIEVFKKKEEYLACAELDKIYKRWMDFKNKSAKKKRGRPKKKPDGPITES